MHDCVQKSKEFVLSTHLTEFLEAVRAGGEPVFLDVEGHLLFIDSASTEETVREVFRVYGLNDHLYEMCFGDASGQKKELFFDYLYRLSTLDYSSLRDVINLLDDLQRVGSTAYAHSAFEVILQVFAYHGYRLDEGLQCLRGGLVYVVTDPKHEVVVRLVKQDPEELEGREVVLAGLRFFHRQKFSPSIKEGHLYPVFHRLAKTWRDTYGRWLF